MTLLLHQGNLPQRPVRNETSATLRNSQRPSLHHSPAHPNEIESLNGSWLFAPWSPAVDIIENEHAISFSLDIPGIHDGLEIVLEHGLISISGQRSYSDPLGKDKTASTLQRQERPAGAFSRHFKLPMAIDASRIHTSYIDGVLYILLPKSNKPSAGSYRLWMPSTAQNSRTAQN